MARGGTWGAVAALALTVGGAAGAGSSACGGGAAPDGGARGAEAGEPAGGTASDGAAPSAVRDATSAVREDAAAMDPAGCGDCHVREARAWSGSAHHGALTNAVFRAEFELAEQPACVRCHAPAADAEQPEGAAAAEGVGCAACHVRGRDVVAVHVSGRAPHAVVADAAFATPAACAPCHDFPFARAGGRGHDPAAPLQRTLHEWQALPGAPSCQQCHMPGGDHAFPGGRDAALLARALTVDARAARTTHGTHVAVTLRAADVGHAVPTGDVFRRLVVRVWPDGDARDARSVTLTRRFARRGGLLREVDDQRVPAGGARTVELELPHAAHVAWRVEWWALDARLAEDRWLDEEDVRRTVAAGRVEVTR